MRSHPAARVGRRVLPAALAAGAALIVGATLVVGGAPPAGAHATLVGTAPAADSVVDAVPDQVELRFDEPVETVDNAVQVFGPAGDRVDLGTVEALDGAATLRAPVDADTQGTYTVAWRVTSEDGHTLSGSFVFHNGTRTGAVAVDDAGAGSATSVAGGIGRWFGYAGTLTAVGAAAVALLRPRPPQNGRETGLTMPGPSNGPTTTQVVPGAGAPTAPGGLSQAAARAAGPPAAPGGLSAAAAPTAAPPIGDGDTVTETSTGTIAPPHPGVEITTAPGADLASARLRRLAVAGALVGAAGSFLALLAMLAESTGRGLYDTLSLVAELAPDTRSGQLALLRVAFGLAAGAAAVVVAVWRRSPLPALALAAGALATASLAGHAWTAPNRWVAVVSDLAHVGAVAVWAGGLLALLVALPVVTADARVQLATRFSGLALVAVGVVAVSGTVSGWQQVGSVGALTSTSYGRLLLAKVAGFVVLVGLGWVNRARLVPLVERAAAPLRRSLRIEVLVAALVLAVTAALVNQPPARTAVSSEPFDTTATADTGEVVDATVDPATAGPNDIHLYFYAASGSEPLAVDAVQVAAGTGDVPARRLQVTPVSTNHVTVAGASLPSAGTWTIQVTAVRAGQPLTFTFEVPIT